MDLSAEQVTHLKTYLGDWLRDTRLELESSFSSGGGKGTVDSTTFLQVSQRLQAKGFRAQAQEQYLNILLPNHMRFTLEGLGILQAYCKDDSLENKTFTAMIKDRAFRQSNLEIEEYNMRYKIRREEELTATDPRVREVIKRWPKQQKAFRLIRRWSFEGRGVRVDLSMVRQSPREATGDYQWSTTFLERNVLAQPPSYEVEVELLRTGVTDTVDGALKALISGVGEVLRGIQKNTLLIRRSVAQSVRREYAEMMGGERLRGVAPVTLETKNMLPVAAVAAVAAEDEKGVEDLTPNIRKGYNVTDKADGVRTMGFVDGEGELWLLDQSMNVYRTGLQNRHCRRSLVDGEWVTQTKEGKAIHHFLIFDLYAITEDQTVKKVSRLPFATLADGVLDREAESRYVLLQDWFATWKTEEKVIAKGVTDANRLMVALKEFYIAPPGSEIFRHCARVLDTPRVYHTDGLILTSNDQPLPDAFGATFRHQFKWKPARDNTVDFFVSIEKDRDYPTVDREVATEDPVTRQFVRYKVLRLYVGGSQSKEEAAPRDTILYQRVTVEERGKRAYRPILFSPLDHTDPMANTCYVTIENDRETEQEYIVTEDSHEPIQDHSIVEMRYDLQRPDGRRWVPSRIRHDKTERLQRAIAAAKAEGRSVEYGSTMNSEAVANSVWSSIHEPVTESMIRNGSEQPTAEEWRAMMPLAIAGDAGAGDADEEEKGKYYERKAPETSLALIAGLTDFHNKYIKNEILLRRALLGYRKTVLDVACGKAGDLYKWTMNRAGVVVGVDMSPDNIMNPFDGAYSRYLRMLKEGQFRHPPKCVFAVGDSSKSIVDGGAAASPEDRDILRSVFGRAEPEGALPPYVQTELAGRLRGGVDVAACMFALHYFFENRGMLEGFLQNLANTVKIGGMFVGCCFDGQRVFDLLRGVGRGQTKTGTENDVPLWSITKEYDADHLEDADDVVGMAIDVYFINIGMKHREYLVPFEYLQRRMGEIGFRLLNREELAQLQLQASTNTFDVSYKMAQAAQPSGQKDKNPYYMLDVVKQFSFLNRWFIFKRAGLTAEEMAAAAAAEAVEAVEAVAEPQGEEINRRFGPELTRFNRSYGLYSIVDASQYSVLKPWEKKSVKAALQEWFSPARVRRIVDATAHIGVDTIHFSELFPNALIDAFEIVPETYAALVKNIARFRKTQQIRPRNEDIVQWEPTYVVDFLYVDPPWGGKSYKDKELLDLYLQREGNAANEAKNVNTLIEKWLGSGKIRSVVLKAPFNFNAETIQRVYRVEVKDIMDTRGVKKEKDKEVAPKLAYRLYHIRSKDIQVDEPEEAALPALPAIVEADQKDEKEEASILAEYRQPTRKFTSKEILLFGPSVAIKDVLKLRSPPLTVRSDHAGRWLSFSAPFPFSDPELTDAKGQPIRYPTMEHYLAAMKYRLVSNRPDFAVSIFSMAGAIHKSFVMERLKAGRDMEEEAAEAKEAGKRERKIRDITGTPADDKLVEAENLEVRKRFLSPFLEQNKVQFDEEKWLRPLRPDDPLPLRDRVLRDALQTRWEKDANFRAMVEEARKQKLYLLYTLPQGAGAGPEAAEWAGRLELTGLEKGRIKGSNRVGWFIMEIAGW